MIEDLICSQEENSGTRITKGYKNALVSVVPLREEWYKQKRLKQFECLKTPRMSEGTRKRRAERAGVISKRFGKNYWSIEKCLVGWKKFYSWSPSQST